MSRINQAIYEIQKIDSLAKEDRWMNHIHPLVKLLLNLYYITLAVSFHRYDVEGLLAMFIYPVACFIIGELSLRDALHRLRVVLPVVCIVGVFNPIFDHTVVGYVGGVAIWGGVVSMITLMLKGILTVFATYILIATTSIEGICYALRLLHVPKMIVTQILLIYRYITVLLAETKRITQAYALRAPGQKGIHYKAWGPLVGQLLLRTMDRADDLYESMLLRGFNGEFPQGKPKRQSAGDVIYLLFWVILLFILRTYPVLTLIGGLFV
ncbi:MAG: cobalt ECF transporter T component CbiQ [Lachnospiraceae bacterium]|nr:cobalt ECF transporter T component CbiQ [Lachnospiraceae bacterium]